MKLSAHIVIFKLTLFAFTIITLGMPNIFINYRKSDSESATGRLYDDLDERYGSDQVFRDLYDIKAGEHWKQRLREGIDQCKAFLVIIGPTWLTATNETSKPRLNEAHDWVKQEIVMALKRNVRIIPVLVEGASVPKRKELPEELKALLDYQAQELSDKHWGHDLGELIGILDKIIEPVKPGEDLLAYCPYFQGEKEIHERDIRAREKVMAGSVLAALLLPFGIAAALGDPTGLLKDASRIIMIIGPIMLILLAAGREGPEYFHRKALVRECIRIVSDVDCKNKLPKEESARIRANSRDSIKKRIDDYM